MFKTIVQFFLDVKSEFGKVSWPNSRELWQSTLIVFVVSALTAVFIGIVDLGLSRLVTLVLG
ncbi:MAG: preprotein translocase subunit SecE [Candidatus Edwardsbacteria bacterium]|jgi:preprotein translocase subunit SecE|nr:preprotein translocase subunit SecE [Candidatus Edwardsbacteria bacterium]